MAQQSIDAMKLALTQHGMYSPLEKATMGVNRTKGTPAEFMAEASKQPGFRKEEVTDRKLQLPDQKLTKAEMLQHLQKSPLPKITEHTLHDFGDEEDALQHASQAIYGQDYDEVLDEPNAVRKVEDWVKKHTAKYQKYQLPGGKNYREVLLQTPHFSDMDRNRLMELEADKRRSSYPEHWGDPRLNRELADLEKRKASMGEQYHTSHWEGHPNIIAHMRMSDRTGPNKEKLLHIEEIQSDWHQEGRKKGYHDPEKLAQADATIKALKAEHKRLGEVKELAQTPEEREAISKHRLAIMEKIRETDISPSSHVPDAPFKKNWHELAIKHALHHAAKHGYHGVVITPGQEQAERYPRRDESEKVAQEKGMKGFYDKIVPDYLNNIGKKYGVKTQLHAYPIETGREQMIPDNANLGMIRSGNPEYAQAHHFPITEPMRQQILQGQPMYKMGGIIHKAEGGNVQPSIAQMRMALQQGNPIAAQNIGVDEAPNMSPKMYFSPSQNEDDMPNTGNSFDQNGVPVGGVDENILQPGTQFIAQSQQPPQGAQGGLPMQPPQGGAPTGPQGPTPPMGNMLSMTPQGQAMQALGPKGPPQAPGTQLQPGTQPTPGMADGGGVTVAGATGSGGVDLHIPINIGGGGSNGSSGNVSSLGQMTGQTGPMSGQSNSSSAPSAPPPPTGMYTNRPQMPYSSVTPQGGTGQAPMINAPGQATSGIGIMNASKFPNMSEMLAGLKGGFANTNASQNSGLYGYGPQGALKPTYEQYVSENDANLARKQAQGPTGTDDYVGPTLSREQWQARQNQPVNRMANGGNVSGYSKGGPENSLHFPPSPALMKSEIEAHAERMARQVAGLDNPNNKTIQQLAREQNLPLGITKNAKKQDVPVIDFEKAKGSYSVGVPGDPSRGGVVPTTRNIKRYGMNYPRAGESLKSIGGENLESPVPMYGGKDYGAYGHPEGWASDLGASAGMFNIVKRLHEEDPTREIYGHYHKMSPESLNHAVHMMDAVLSHHKPHHLPAEQISYLNHLMRNVATTTSKSDVQYPQFPGFENPEDVMFHGSLNSGMRKKLINILGTEKYLPGGKQKMNDIIYAMSHPELRNIETGAGGSSILKFDPTRELRESISSHPTYGHDIPSKLVGRTRYITPAEILSPRSMHNAKQAIKAMGKKVLPFNQAKMSIIREPIDEQYVNQMGEYETAMKKRLGYKKGGNVTLAPTQDTMRLALTKKKAK